METALFYYKYSNRNPAEWNFAIDKNASKLRTNIDYPFIRAYRIKSELVALGETTGEIDFTKMRIYDRDRTICDVLKNMTRMDREIFNKAKASGISYQQCLQLFMQEEFLRKLSKSGHEDNLILKGEFR